MRMLLATLALLIVAQAAIAEEPPQYPAEQIEFFERQVRPILVARCVECHGGKKQEAGLRLDSRTAAIRGSDEHPVIAPGDADASHLIAAVRYDGDIQMPPKKKLPEEQIAALTKWVALGAPWPDEPVIETKLDPTSAEGIRAARREHWAYQAIALPPVPQLPGEQPASAIDAFVLARLNSAGIAPSPPADHRTLLRRASFTLTGLPPTFEEVRSFSDDLSPDAWRRTVDRLLESPTYGQRWARHWLDVARYADTKGYALAGQEARYPFAYTYRDYVVDALNDDLPYNQFVLEQLAADQLSGPRRARAQAALGFLTVGRRFIDRQDEIIDDRIDVVTRGLLGMTVSCARCHDHKYDPLPTADYYSLYGVFASCEEPNELPLLAEPDDSPGSKAFQAELAKRRQAVDQHLATQHAEITRLLRGEIDLYLLEIVRQQDAKRVPNDLLKEIAGKVRRLVVDRWMRRLEGARRHRDPVFAAWLRLAELPDEKYGEQAAEALAQLAEPQGAANPLVLAALQASPPQSLVDVAQTYGKVFREFDERWRTLQKEHGDSASEKLSPAEEQLHAVLYGPKSPIAMPRDDVERAFNVAQRNALRSLEAKVSQWEAFGDHSPPRAMILVDKPTPHNPHIFLRGSAGRPGPTVPRQFLAILSGDDRQPFRTGSGRLELARKIIDPANPLTARVIVNRVWMHHFGHGLVRTPSNFGARGEPPTHPELLDYLAARFMAHGWSLKRLHREIMASQTYRRQSLPRSEALAVDPENRLLWRMNRRRLEFEPLRDAMLAYGGRLDAQLGGRPVDLGKQPFSTRRTLYGLTDRQNLFSTLRIFNVASPDASTPMRPQTTIPQQSLFLLNSPFVVEQARHLANREEVARQAEPEQRVQALYRIVLCRDADAEEMALALRLIDSQSKHREDGDQLDPWAKLAHVLLLTNEAAFID